MAMPTHLNVALKEWKTVCDALGSGRQIILLRKGGIYEAAGEFEIEHRQFLLFPTYLHQKPEMLKTGEQEKVSSVSAEPAHITLEFAGEITDIIPMPKREAMDAIDDQHIWAKPLIDMRYAYRPENPLYLLVVRVYRLEHAVTIENTPAYAGCKSWVPLGDSVDVKSARPVMDETDFESMCERILLKIKAEK
jgi:hypothetical protein